MLIYFYQYINVDLNESESLFVCRRLFVSVSTVVSVPTAIMMAAQSKEDDTFRGLRDH
jgi:hypothetical protein